MPHTPLTGLGVLIVEDEPLLRRQIAANLERLGADVTAAGTLEPRADSIAESAASISSCLDVNLPDDAAPIS